MPGKNKQKKMHRGGDSTQNQSATDTPYNTMEHDIANVTSTETENEAQGFYGEIEKADTRIKELRTTVESYMKRYSDAFGEGGHRLLVEKMLEDEKRARESLKSAVEAFRTGATADIPVEKTLQFLAQSMERLENVLSRAQQLDASAAIPESLRKQISSFYDYAHDSITNARQLARDVQQRATEYRQGATEYASEKVTQVEHAVKRNETIRSVYSAIENLREKVTEHEAFHGAQDILRRASEQLNESLTQLRTVPTTEVPMAAVLESLKLSRNAVNTVTVMVQSSETSRRVSQPVIDRIKNAKTMAAEAIQYATDTFKNVQGKAWDFATSAERYAVQQAAKFDVEYDVIGRTKKLAGQLNEQYKVADKAQSVSTYAQDIIKNYELDIKAQKALNSAKEMDSQYVGGRMTDLVKWAYAQLETGKAHATQVQQEFYNERKGISSDPVPAAQIISESE